MNSMSSYHYFSKYIEKTLQESVYLYRYGKKCKIAWVVYSSYSTKFILLSMQDWVIFQVIIQLFIRSFLNNLACWKLVWLRLVYNCFSYVYHHTSVSPSHELFWGFQEICCSPPFGMVVSSDTGYSGLNVVPPPAVPKASAIPWQANSSSSRCSRRSERISSLQWALASPSLASWWDVPFFNGHQHLPVQPADGMCHLQWAPAPPSSASWWDVPSSMGAGTFLHRSSF